MLIIIQVNTSHHQHTTTYNYHMTITISIRSTMYNLTVCNFVNYFLDLNHGIVDSNYCYINIVKIKVTNVIINYRSETEQQLRRC